MYRDFIVKQTSKFDSEYKTKTLIGNWYEERCNPNNAYSEFYRQRKLVEPSVTFTQEKFQKTTDNPINFQPYNPKETFNTEYKQNYLQLENQKRLSVLKPFITKQSQFDKNKQALEEYREKWTKSKHIYDKSRTYLGVEKKI